MNAITIAAIVVVAIVAVLLLMRRDRPRRIGGGDGGPDRTPAPPRPHEGAPGIRHNPALSNLTEADRAEIAQEIASGKKISAIKLVREKTGMGLKEAKEFVEDFTSDGRH
jgi:hypothetical protein